MIHIDTRRVRGGDLRVLDRVRRVLWDHEPLRFSGSVVELNIDQEAVSLVGRVRTQTLKEVAGYLARSVEGVNGVVNHLVSDPEVVRAVADALAQDPVTRPHVIRIEARLGRVKLLGLVPSAEIERLAIEVAASVPLITAVTSELEVDPQAMEPGPGVVVIGAANATAGQKEEGDGAS